MTIEAVLDGYCFAELFSESVEKSVRQGNCPGFIVSSSEEGLRKQHPSLGPIHTQIIRPTEMTSVKLTGNMHFSYSSARDVYTEYDLEISSNNSITHNWQSYASGCDIKWSKVNYGRETYLCVNRGTSGEIRWTFQAKSGEKVQIDNLLVYVDSTDNVKWQLKIWTSDNQLNPIELSPKQEKFDNLNQAVTRMELTAKLLSTEAKIFEENAAKNQIGMLVAINKATEVYLNDKGYLNDDFPTPSVQNKKKAFAMIPNRNGMLVYENNHDYNQAMISKKT